MIREVIRRCPFCGRENPVSSQEYAENPFCNACLDDRVSRAGAHLGNFTCRLSGVFYEIIPETETTSSDAPSHLPDFPH